MLSIQFFANVTLQHPNQYNYISQIHTGHVGPNIYVWGIIYNVFEILNKRIIVLQY